MKEYGYMIATLVALGTLGCEHHQAKCDDAVKRLSPAALVPAQTAAAGDDAKLKTLWTGVLNDAEQGQKQCTAAGDSRSGLVLDQVHTNAQAQLDGIAARPAYNDWKGTYCKELWEKVSPEVTACCKSDVVAWKASACPGKESKLLAVLSKASDLCKNLSGADCKPGALAQADGSISYENGDWSVYYCPEKNCNERFTQLQSIYGQVGGAGGLWHRTGIRWSVVHTNSKPTLSPDQDALLKKYTDPLSTE